jgi:hypothetical protein
MACRVVSRSFDLGKEKRYHRSFVIDGFRTVKLSCKDIKQSSEQSDIRTERWPNSFVMYTSSKRNIYHFVASVKPSSDGCGAPRKAGKVQRAQR